MDESLKGRLLRINGLLIEEGAEVSESSFNNGVIGAPTYVELKVLHRWWAKVKSFAFQLGSAARPWNSTFAKEPEVNTLAFVEEILGTLEAIKYEIENDHLATVTQVIKAETLADLLEQAEHLDKNGYFLAAGVIGRSVLEEHLRNLCELQDCNPDKPRPTINDFNQALYKREYFSKTRLKHVEVLASIGNDAAHNKSELEAGDIKKLLMDLPGFIEQTSV